MLKNRYCFVFAMLIMLSSGTQAGINPENLNLVNFQNRTGGTIEYLFLSPGDSNFWSTDILGSSRVLSDGDTIGFYIHYPHECDNFDFMAIDTSGNAFTLWDFEICDGTEASIPLYENALQDSAPDMDLGEVVIRNDLNYDIHYLFFSPSDSQMWGVDQLDKSTILKPGESVSLLVPMESYGVRYDVQAIDKDTDSYTFSVELDSSQDAYAIPVEPSDIDPRS